MSSREDNIVLIAGGVAFFSLLSAVPALATTVSVYGLFADPADIPRRVDDFGATMPAEARELITNQLTALTADRSGLGVGLVIGLIVALWGASTALKQLMVALTRVHRRDETRSYVRLRLVAMEYTIATIVFLAVVLLLVAVAPSIGDGAVGVGVGIARWPALALLMIGALSLLYRYAPDCERPPWRIADRGAMTATALWLLTTLTFSLYAGRIGSYNQTYGAFAGMVLFMLWLFLSALSVLVGAEVNAAIERSGS